MRRLLLTVAVLFAGSIVTALEPDVLRSVNAVPAHLAGRFRDVRGFQQSASGQLFIFDRRGHTVYGIDETHTGVWEIVQVGGEPGRIIDPTAFSVAPDGSFVVADAPQGRGRIQVFTPVGFRIGGFLLPASSRPRVTFDNLVLNGIGSLQYTGSSILISQPENGALVTEYDFRGRTIRTFGALRATGHEHDRDVHLALNTGMALVDRDSGYFFVFQAGLPVLRRYDAEGHQLFERQMQGREIDELIANLPAAWPRSVETGELPIVPPTIRTAAVDAAGHLWVSFAVPYTYVYDRDGDKIRTVQFRAAGLVAPSGLFFGPRGRLLVTPGLYEFAP